MQAGKRQDPDQKEDEGKGGLEDCWANRRVGSNGEVRGEDWMLINGSFEW
jgi:hypothetical protein